MDELAGIILDVTLVSGDDVYLEGLLVLHAGAHGVHAHGVSGIRHPPAGLLELPGQGVALPPGRLLRLLLPPARRLSSVLGRARTRGLKEAGGQQGKEQEEEIRSLVCFRSRRRTCPGTVATILMSGSTEVLALGRDPDLGEQWRQEPHHY